jgi:hypothetical protein
MKKVDTGGPARFPLADIVEIRLRFDPTRFDTRRYRCDLHTRSGQEATIWSTHFLSVAQFEDRRASFVSLVRALASGVALANPGCRFVGGRPPLTYWMELGFLAITMLFLVAALTLLEGAIGSFIWFRLLLVAFWVPLVITYTRRNWPRRFDPTNIQDALLPISTQKYA